MYDTPILLLVFNRPDTTRQVLAAIRAARPRQLFIAADGPRPLVPQDVAACAAVRRLVLESIDWDCTVHTLFQDRNLGCGIAPATAIDWFFSQVSEGIILEDDCLPGADFFSFAAAMLERYRSDARVMHISGNNFQFGKQWGNGSYYFSRHINAWGWATWRRAWQLYDFRLRQFSETQMEAILRSCLSTDRERHFWRPHFEAVRNGQRADIWDYQWVYTVWAHDGIAVTPNMNLVSNIGFGAGATHTHDAASVVANNPVLPLGTLVHPARIELSPGADRRLFRLCHQPRLTLRDRAYYAKRWLLQLLKFKMPAHPQSTY